MSEKLIPKLLTAWSPIVVLSDNTRVLKPIINRPIKYTLLPGEFYINVGGRKILAKSNLQEVKLDNRNLYLLLLNLKRSKVLREAHEQLKKEEEAMKTLGALGTMITPSTYIGPIFNDNGKSYMDNMMSGEGTGSAAGNIAIDLLTPAVVGKGILGVSNASKWVSKSYKPFIISLYMNKSYRPNGLSTVNNLFRNREWSNFLATKNGNYYYRLLRKPGLVSTNVRKDNGGYFISHTTPWEEFSGLGSELPNGMKVLYEFPEDVFGKLPASSSNGFYGPDDVSELGKLHLLYGNTSSGKRSLVRVLSDDQAKLLDISPFKIGIEDRPKSSAGFYDNNPIYERLSLGNLTVVSPLALNNALLNKSYNMYLYSPQGIIKSIYSPPPPLIKYLTILKRIQ